jgi:hypothetical protein
VKNRTVFMMRARKAPMALALAVWGAMACAQPVYVMSALVVPSGQAITPLVIDAQDRVWGSAVFHDGLGLLPGSFWGFGVVHRPALVRWPSTAAKTVVGSRVSAQAKGSLRAASADGSQLVVPVGPAVVYDAFSGRPRVALRYPRAPGGSEPVSSPTVQGVSNDGQLLVNHTLGSVLPHDARTGLWRHDNEAVALPLGGHVGQKGLSIRADGAVAGVVYQAGHFNERAAVWVDGALQVLDQQAGRGSAALAINAQGQVLMRVCVQQERSHFDGVTTRAHSVYGPPGHVLSHKGAETPLLPTMAGEVLVPRAMNASGMVVGRMGPRKPRISEFQVVPPSASPDEEARPGRAFVWHAGRVHDLNEWVAARGVSLPPGAVLQEALAINDAGSILATLRDSDGTVRPVRLLNARRTPS